MFLFQYGIKVQGPIEDSTGSHGSATNVLTSDGPGQPVYWSAGGGGGGSGTVTSVALSLPSIFSVSGSPVTTSGTLTGTLANQAANLVFAGPAAGGPAVPTFRALVAADIAGLVGGVTALNALTGSLTISGTGVTVATPTSSSITLRAALFTTSSSPPVSPTPIIGDRWVSDVTGIEYVYYYDGTTYQWVQFGGTSNAASSNVFFAATRTTTQQSSGSTIIFNNEITDTTSSYNPGTGIFTAPVAGRYLFTADTEFTNSTGSPLGMQLRINCSIAGDVAAHSANYASGVTFAVSTTVIVDLAIGETVQVTTNVALSGTFVVTATPVTRFTGYLMVQL